MKSEPLASERFSTPGADATLFTQPCTFAFVITLCSVLPGRQQLWKTEVKATSAGQQCANVCFVHCTFYKGLWCFCTFSS